MQKIQRVSRFFRILFQLSFIISPLLVAISWIKAPAPVLLAGGLIQCNAIPKEYQAKILHALSTSERWQAFLVDLLPLSITLSLLYFLIRLFYLFENGDIFTLSVVQYIRKVGYMLLLGQLVNPIYSCLMGLVLTLQNPPGQRVMQITFSNENVGTILIALVTILISWIMAEGCKLSEEQRLII